MRIAWIGLTALALAGCDSGGVPSPADRMAGDDPQYADAVDLDLVILRSEGLTAGPDAFYFAAGQNEVEAALTNVLGEPISSNQMDECGAGPMAMSAYPGALTVNFQNGMLVGWNVAADEAGEAAKIQIEGDIALGTSADGLGDLPGYLPIEGSTLGEEFALGDQLGGFVEEGAVSMLYAGTQCFFR